MKWKVSLVYAVYKREFYFIKVEYENKQLLYHGELPDFFEKP